MLDRQRNTINVNKTQALLQTTGSKDEPNIAWECGEELVVVFWHFAFDKRI